MTQPRRSYHEPTSALLPPMYPGRDLDATEREAAIAICDRALYRMDAKRLLAMCGLLRDTRDRA